MRKCLGWYLRIFRYSDLFKILNCFELADGCERIFCLEGEAAGYEDVDTGFYYSRGSVGIYATIYLNECVAATRVDHLAQTLNLVYRRLNELLTSKAWIDGHDEYHVGIGKDFFHCRKWGRGIQRNAGFHSGSMYLLDGAVQMKACLGMNGHHRCSQFGGSFDELLWMHHHEVNIHLFLATSAHGIEHGEAERDVRYKLAVHDVEVEPVGFATVNHFDLAFEMKKVCCKE